MRLVPLVLLLVATPAVAAPVPKAIKKKFPDYYPLTAGATWVYNMGATEVTVRVKSVEEKDGVKTGVLATEHNGKEVATETIRVDKDGVTRTHVNNTKVDPELLILKFGLADEEGWTVKSKVQQTEVGGTFTLKGVEKVTVPAGELDAVVVKGDCKIAGTATQMTHWFADGVGIVRLKYTIGGQDSAPLELKKYTPGESPKSK